MRNRTVVSLSPVDTASTEENARTATIPTRPATPTGAGTTRRLLLAGAVSAPLRGTVALAQARLRSDFDVTVQPLSALSTGALGRLRITDFVVGGLLTVAGAVGLRRRAPDSPWSARLVGVHGVGFVAAGGLVLDPAGLGVLTRHGFGHMLVGTLAFVTLAAACLVLAVHVRRAGRPGVAVVFVPAATSWSTSSTAAMRTVCR